MEKTPPPRQARAGVQTLSLEGTRGAPSCAALDSVHVLPVISVRNTQGKQNKHEKRSPGGRTLTFSRHRGGLWVEFKRFLCRIHTGFHSVRRSILCMYWASPGSKPPGKTKWSKKTGSPGALSGSVSAPSGLVNNAPRKSKRSSIERAAAVELKITSLGCVPRSVGKLWGGAVAFSAILACLDVFTNTDGASERRQTASPR